LGLDAQTWARARGWALWKALIVAANPNAAANPAHSRTDETWRVLRSLLAG